MKASLVFSRVALLLTLVLLLFTGSSSAGAAGVLLEHSPTVTQEEPATVWSIQWTTTMTASGDTGGDPRTVEHYHYLNTGSLLYREYADGSFDNINFKLHVDDDFQRAETHSCSTGSGSTGQAHNNIHGTTDNPDRYNGNPAGHYTFSPMHLPDDGWQGYVSYEWNPGYTFSGQRRESGADCSESWDRSDAWEMEWAPLCIYARLMTGNKQGTEFTYQATGTDLATACFGPLSYGFVVDPDEVYWRVDLSVRLVAARDLTVERLEVTQGLQDTGNSLPLVQGRRTIVRAYLGIGSDPGPVRGVAGELEGYANGAKLGSVVPINPAGGIDAPDNPEWKNIDDTLNFELPEAWTQQPSLHLKATVNKARGIVESNYDNNDRTADINFQDCTGISIGYAPVSYAPAGGAPAGPSANIVLGQLFLQKVYPVADTELEYVPRGAMTVLQNVNTNDNDIALLESLETMLLASSAPHPEHIFGWLPALAYDDNGLAFRPGLSGFGNETTAPDRWRRTFAHEIGHNYGLRHSDLTTGGAHWFDVYDLAIKPVPPSAGGDNLLDMMVPERLEPEAWVSAQNYRYLVGKLCSGGGGMASSASGASPAGDNLLVTAILSSTPPVSGSLGPLLSLASAPAHLPPPGAQYCVALLDGARKRLSNYCFDQPLEDDSINGPAAGLISMVVPRPEGLQQVELSESATGAVLSTRAASAHAPAVSVTFPNMPGLALNGLQTIRWAGSDLDGDPLSYTVLYSRDNGVTWLGAAASVMGPSVVLDFSRLPGTAGAAAGLIRVLASDGFYTAEDTTDAPFTVDDKAPAALILAPASGRTFNNRAAISLLGAGIDLEDGAPGDGAADGALYWESSLDGSLGVGRLVETNLSPGVHTITLTVRDSAGAASTASVQVNVVAVETPRSLYLPLLRR